jgi:hypothetical protein
MMSPQTLESRPSSSRASRRSSQRIASKDMTPTHLLLDVDVSPKKGRLSSGSSTRADSPGSSNRRSPIDVVSEALGLLERPDMPEQELSALMSSLGVPDNPTRHRSVPDVQDKAYSQLVPTLVAEAPSLTSMSTIFPGHSLHVGDGRPHPVDFFDREVARLNPDRRSGTPDHGRRLEVPDPRRGRTLPAAGWSFLNRRSSA